MSSVITTASITVHNIFGPGNGADLVIQSSDKVQFYVHRRNLEFIAGAFPGGSSTEITSGLGEAQVVHLTETADVLEILFEFAYQRRHPTMEDLPFEKLVRVADAAEKYDFYSAAPMCQLALRRYIPKEPMDVFRLAVKHDYPDEFIDEVALELCLKRVSPTLDPRTHGSVAPAWTIYYQAWQDVFKNACHRYYPEGLELCFLVALPAEYEEIHGHEFDYVKVYNLHPCDRCYSSLVAWMSKLSDRSSLASIKEQLTKRPSSQECMAILEGCPCPPPFDRASEKNHDKTEQNFAVIAALTDKCRNGIESMQSFTGLMRKYRS